jgi:hypothetical protein
MSRFKRSSSSSLSWDNITRFSSFVLPCGVSSQAGQLHRNPPFLQEFLALAPNPIAPVDVRNKQLFACTNVLDRMKSLLVERGMVRMSRIRKARMIEARSEQVYGTKGICCVDA